MTNDNILVSKYFINFLNTKRRDNNDIRICEGEHKTAKDRKTD